MSKRQHNQQAIGDRQIGDRPPTTERNGDNCREWTHVVEIPMRQFPAGHHVTTHLDLQLTKTQGAALKRIWAHCVQHNTKMANGRVVYHLADAVRWLLESIESAD